MVLPTVAQPLFVLACFQLRLLLSDGLMQPPERFFSFSYLLSVTLSLSSDKLNACCVVLLTELGLPIMQDLADALRADRGDRCRVSGQTASYCILSLKRATR